MRFFLLFACLAPLTVSAQDERYWETGFLLGAGLYSGDLTEKYVEIAETRPAFGAYLRFQHNNHLASRLHVLSGSLSGDDKYSAARASRSIRFSTTFTELGAALEYHPFSHSRFSKTGIHRRMISPYAYLGLGVAFANPEAVYYGPPDMRKTLLKAPVPEENISHVFPLGIAGGGLRFDLFDLFILGAELGVRPMLSDDLDGVKLNGNPKRGDWYFYGGLTATFILSKPKYISK